MSRIHFVVKEAEKVRYQAQASREGKSLGQWLREAADERLAAARPRKFTLEELREFNAACDARRSDAPEPDWPEVKRVISESRLSGIETT
ncbi:hypothetical protein [Candidatus Palauibacter soopunensis]|uniref:hypothetical protein n=1 Tax=Candidatus Palauibacter soopunensis TaxID=3056739 RepID=UPI002387C867|nr:hypothetical protein [Candidatus Palauibacter soopunensis]MDE2877649.1 hypothetical protein [Candidatus Palauibacter soopunensis]